jgi:hypothetical protein
LETFAEPREFTEDAAYDERKVRTLEDLDPGSIDAPIRDLVLRLIRLPHCFTLQSCYGHFVYPGRTEPGNPKPLPREDVGRVRYRIAYMALCIQSGGPGRRLRAALGALVRMDPEYIQFGSPGWFWDRHPNSYALQVEPERFRDRDQAEIEHREALHIERVRDSFFGALRDVVTRESLGAS